MSHRIRKSHTVSIRVYHFGCPAKYRRAVFEEKVDPTWQEVCLEIAPRDPIEFLELGPDPEPVHCLVPAGPSYRPTKMIPILQSLTAREVLARVPSVKKQLWGSEFWTEGYSVGTVGPPATAEGIRPSVKNPGQENEYQPLQVQQLKLFERSDTPSACGGVVHLHCAK